ncbi:MULTISPECIES: class I SAM-dependent methyltransferase [Nocardiopsis]|uniref:Phospholipid N-methyltransferase n=1 Tax=Nocardiopsis sinuspersici TaxID=501010 RepID=A0A1V3C618_9ACTN|nr:MULTISPECIES: methyltransferase domain-containing protein [Nocardiopsis]NYH52498.1 phospholipid N-methyltransferase [Nocardiopsis sinuspersici]OOC55976.1 phospholipid methyltransferase [Nocardiopsis sinuspersici]
MSETHSPTGPFSSLRLDERLRDTRLFFSQALRTFHATGSIVPSSTALAHAMAEYVRQRPEPDRPLRILEAGAGTGAISRGIAAAMRPGDTADLVESNPEFAAHVEDLLETDPVMSKVSDSVEVHAKLVNDMGTDRSYDVIVSGLPFANFDVDTVREILDYYFEVLEPGGTMSFYGYLYTKEVKAVIARREDYLRQARTSWLVQEWIDRYGIGSEKVFANIPPAWVHHLRKPGKTS